MNSKFEVKHTDIKILCISKFEIDVYFTGKYFLFKSQSTLSLFKTKLHAPFKRNSFALSTEYSLVERSDE